MIHLSNGFCQAIECRTTTLYGLQVIHLINTLAFKNEICCSELFRIRKNKDLIPVIYCFPGGVEQVGIIIISFATSTEDICLAFYGWNSP
jgi:hypothetical protein